MANIFREINGELQLVEPNEQEIRTRMELSIVNELGFSFDDIKKIGIDNAKEDIITLLKEIEKAMSKNEVDKDTIKHIVEKYGLECHLGT